MTFQNHDMSDPNMPSTWLHPDILDRAMTEDYEAGPVALEDTSEGLSHQTWHLTYSGGDLIITPELFGDPVVVRTIAEVTQCTLAFDQNAHINLAYTAAGLPYLYWYDTALGDWTTTQLDTGAITPTICMDDKRVTQTNVSDILLFFTIETSPGVYTLYHREQRDRYQDLYPHAVGVKPYIHKLGMHNLLRVQIGLSYRY